MEKIKILILEDNDSDLDLVMYELKKLKAGKELIICKNKNEYLTALKDNFPDVILSDYNLPDIDGEEALDILRKKNTEIPFILVSATIGEEKAVNLMRNGANDFIMKDKLKKLNPTIEREIREFENRKQAKIEHSELIKLTTAVNQSPSIIVITDTDGMVEFVNPKFTETTGFTYKDVVDRDPQILKSGEMSDEVYSKLWKHITSGNVWRGEFRNRKKNGDFYWEGATVAPVFDENRKITNFLKVSKDISRQKEDEEKLLISEEKFRLISENVNDVISTIDLNGNFLYISPSIKKLRGYDPEELIGTSFVDALTAESQNKVYPLFKSVVSEILNGKTDFKPIVLEIKQPCKDGSFVETEIVITIIFDENDKFRFALGVSRNIDERKKNEALLLKQKQDLVSSNKELEQFAYIASHDLQEPLRIISSFAQLLEMKHSDRLNDEAKEYISYVVTGAKRMQNLIKGLLEYSRITSRTKPRTLCNLSVPLKDALYNLNLTINETRTGLTIKELPDASVEPDQIAHIFQNLIGNAIKFKKDDEECRIEIGAEKDSTKNEWLVYVKDNGIGIESKDFDKVFIIFKRLAPAAKRSGDGIGLALCKRIIERQGGRIWVESEGMGKGSVFKFTIPINSKDGSV